jgi:FkbM family methyltransferase
MSEVELDVAGIRFECADTWVSRWVSSEILEGKTYPHLPFVDDVRVVWDVGANVGATTVFLAHHYPDAEVHAFEPATEPRAILERNAGRSPNIRVHAFGLSDRDQTVPLYHGEGDSGFASVHQRRGTTDESEPVQLRAAGPWARAHGIDRIDVLKLDVEGCELDVLTSLEPLVPSVKVLYVEYESRQARRGIDTLLTGTHELWLSMLMALDQGEGIYVRKDLADGPGSERRLLELFHAGRVAGTSPPGTPPPPAGSPRP